MGGKHFVRSMSAAVLIAGSLVVAGAQPASAWKYFVHGRVDCSITSGTVLYSSTLRDGIHQQVALRAKGTLDCDPLTDPNHIGETGLANGTTVRSGKFRIQSGPFDGECHNIKPVGNAEIEMKINWMSNNGTKIRDTSVSWLWDENTDPATGNPHDSATTSPYGYHFSGITIKDTGISGSYLGDAAVLNMFSTITDAACASTPTSIGKLRGGWPINDPASNISFESPPMVTSVNPGSTVLGTQNLDIDLTGQDLTPADTLSFSGNGITVNSTTFVSASEMQANISIDPSALAGMRDLTVSNEHGANTCVSCFMIAPIVGNVSPATAGQGAQNRNITINGAGFANGAVTQFGTVGGGITTNYTQFVDSNTLIANISVANGAPLGAYDVTVTDPGFGVGTCTGCFSVNSGPTVTGTSPGSRGAGSTNQVVAVNGTGFASDSTLTFGGPGITVDSTSYVSPTQLLATIDIAPGATFGPRSVTALNADGGQGACAACFTVNKGPNPVNWDMLTATGKHSVLRIDSKGRTNRQVYTTDVAITGTNFQPGAMVAYAADWVTVNSTTYISTTKIKQNVTIDVVDDINALPEERTITVTNPDGGTGVLPGAVVLVG